MFSSFERTRFEFFVPFPCDVVVVYLQKKRILEESWALLREYKDGMYRYSDSGSVQTSSSTDMSHVQPLYCLLFFVQLHVVKFKLIS